jgi:hypothetical protein
MMSFLPRHDAAFSVFFCHHIGSERLRRFAAADIDAAIDIATPFSLTLFADAARR